MTFVAALLLAYGPLDWSFPWWVWTLAILHADNDVTVRLRKEKK